MSAARKRQKISKDGASRNVSGWHGYQETEEINGHDTTPTKRLKSSRTLFVRALPLSITNESLTAFFSENYPVKHATVVLDPATKTSKGFGFVTFADTDDAETARQALDNTLFEGKRIKIETAEPRHRDVANQSEEALKTKHDREKQIQEGKKPPKLIVRNLPWSIKKPEQLALLFRDYGKVKFATLPKTKTGLSPGFGFVTLRGRNNAERAIDKVNGKVVEGRALAVDWAVDKEDWAALSKDANKEEESHGPLQNSISKHVDREETRDSLESEASQDANPELIEDQQASDTSPGDGDSQFDEMQSEESERNENTSNLKSKQAIQSTIFVRNLPFNTTDESLAGCFGTFGPVRYARVVIDPATEMSRGTGFVCFSNEVDAKACVRSAPKLIAPKAEKSKASSKPSVLEDFQADPSGRFTMEGRVLHVTQAVDRDAAHRLTALGTSLREARDKDKRRLYLLSEGTIPSNSPLYEKLAPAEIKLREESAKQRQRLIRSNPLLHLSLTRLAVRNLPRNMTSKELKALAREACVGFAADVKAGLRQSLNKEELGRAAEEMQKAEKLRKAKGKGIVNQAKIVFEGREGGKVMEGSGAGRSRGYGFIEYATHRCALMGLRWLNGRLVGGTPAATGDSGAEEPERKRRMVVEFAIENAQVVTRRKKREAEYREGTRVQQHDHSVSVPRKAGTANKRISSNNKTDFLNLNPRKRERGKSGGVRGQVESSNGTGDSKADGKLRRRQQIIGKKRMLRKARRGQ